MPLMVTSGLSILILSSYSPNWGILDNKSCREYQVPYSFYITLILVRIAEELHVRL